MDDPPPLPDNKSRFPWALLIVCVLGFLFSLQIAAAGFVAPIFHDMFADFGPQLPLITHAVIRSHILWAAAGVAAATLSVVFFVQARRGSRPARRSGRLLTLISFLVAQTLTVALFLPVFQLAAATGEPYDPSQTDEEK